MDASIQLTTTSRFVEMLESHHSLVVKALQKLYKHCVNKEGFPGDPLVETADGHPLTHAILDRLGLIKQAEENPDEPEEDTDDLQYLRLLSTSTDSSATSDPSPEPATPPEPTLASTSCQPLPPGWKWEYHPGGQYHYPPDAGYGSVMMRPVIIGGGGGGGGPDGLAESVAVGAAATQGPPPPGNDNSYLYYLDHGSEKNHLSPHPHPHAHTGAPQNGFIPAPTSPHHHIHSHPPSLPVDISLLDYHLPIQDQPLYSGLTPGWHFPGA